MDVHNRGGGGTVHPQPARHQDRENPAGLDLMLRLSKYEDKGSALEQVCQRIVAKGPTEGNSDKVRLVGHKSLTDSQSFSEPVGSQADPSIRDSAGVIDA